MNENTSFESPPRKRIRTAHHAEIIDLTDDPPFQPMPETDEEYARRLQRQLDAEESASTSAPARVAVPDDDAALARALQEEWDAEVQSQQQQSLPDPQYPFQEETLKTNGRGGSSATPVASPASKEFERLSGKSCETCRNSLLPSTQSLVTQRFKAIYSGLSDGSTSLASEGFHTSRSTRCSKKTCFGCGKDITANGSPIRLGTNTVHCNEQRLSLIWILLCGYDTLAEKPKGTKSRKGSSRSSYTHDSRRSSAPAGTGYGGSEDNPFGRPGKKRAGASSSGYTAHDSVEQPLAISEMSDENDKLTAIVMETITDLLPSFERFDNPFDADPPAALAAFLNESSILNKAAEFLRNSSLDDISARAPLYHALVRFVSTLAGHFATGFLVYHDRVRTHHSLLQAVLQQDAADTPNEDNTTASLAASMEELARQCNMMLKDPQLNADEDVTLQLYHAIHDMAQHVQANLGATQPKQKDPNSWQKELSVQELADQQILDAFYFRKDALKMSSIMPSRMKRIISELSTLRASLPDGIFVRYAESRPDCMKILITGPQDTPYADGLFEFDLLCPGNYPAAPPKMQLTTTGRGTARFNPNLYADGKVCLSLLGTWSGPGWNAQGSTILQVLVSIQSMILNGEPYTNEPSWATQYGTEASKQYNRQTHPQTVEFAMLEWVERSGKSVWGEVVQKHFKAQKDQIIKTVAAWKQDMPKVQNFHGRGSGHVAGDPYMGYTLGQTFGTFPNAGYYGPGQSLSGTSAGLGNPGPAPYGPSSNTMPSYPDAWDLGFNQGSMPTFPPYAPSGYQLPGGPSGYHPPAPSASRTVPVQQKITANGHSIGDQSLADLARQLREALPALKDPSRAPRKGR